MHPNFPRALKAHLLKALSALHLPVPDKACGKTRAGHENTPRIRAPQVFIGDLPAKKEEADFPCVLILPASGWQEDGEAATSVTLLCCAYNAEDGDAEGAEMDIALLISAVTQALTPCVGEPLDRRYRLVPEPRMGGDTLRYLHWERSDAQPRPFIQVAIQSHWRMKGIE